MPVSVRIPTPLRKLTNDQEVVEASADTIGSLIEELEKLPESKSDYSMSPAMFAALSMST